MIKYCIFSIKEFFILEESGFEYADKTEAPKGGGQMLILADKGGKGGQVNADEGGRGGPDTPICLD